MRADWLPDVLRETGLDVYVMPGAETVGQNLAQILGVVGHHTASGPNWLDGHVAALLRNGRRDLAGPLAQLGLERDGTFVVVTTGKANHNGYGEWGNASIGIEAYNNGIGEPWAAVQIDAYIRGVTAILRRLGYDADRFKGHRETDPKRKPDPTGIDLDDFRTSVSGLLAPARPPSHLPQSEEDDMGTHIRRTTDGRVEVVTDMDRRAIGPDEWALHRLWGGQTADVDARIFDLLTTGKRIV